MHELAWRGPLATGAGRLMLVDFQRALADLTASPALCRQVRDAPETLRHRYELTDKEWRRLCGIVASKGMEANCMLYRANRLAPVALNLPETCEAIRDELNGSDLRLLGFASPRPTCTSSSRPIASAASCRTSPGLPVAAREVWPASTPWSPPSWPPAGRWRGLRRCSRRRRRGANRPHSDIAYGGSCSAGQREDFAQYDAGLARAALRGGRVASTVTRRGEDLTTPQRLADPSSYKYWQWRAAAANLVAAADLAASLGCRVDAGDMKRTTILVVGDRTPDTLRWMRRALSTARQSSRLRKGQRIRIIREAEDFRCLCSQYRPPTAEPSAARADARSSPTR